VGQVPIETIHSSHAVQGFQSTHKALDTYLKRFALRNANANLGRTYVYTEADSTEVLGYYTICATGISRVIIPGHESLPRYDVIPAMLLGRLAVTKAAQGRGLGRLLLTDALTQAWGISKIAGVYLVAVDAKDEAARLFYVHMEFLALIDDPLHLFIPMSTIIDQIDPPQPGLSAN
jgi:GNAT superfamily N-acetyltransferase